MPATALAQAPADRSLRDLSVRAGAIVVAGARYREQARAPNTLRAYAADWRHFTAWCAAYGATPLPASPELVTLYCVDLAEQGYRYATIERRLAAIRHEHVRAHERFDSRDPQLRDTLRGIRREKGTAPRPKEAILPPTLKRSLDTLHGRDAHAGRAARGGGTRLVEVRDAAMLLLGFLGAFRAGELVGLRRDDVRFTEKGLLVRVRRSKTDQEGKGARKAIPKHPTDARYCAVVAVRRWIDAAGLDTVNPHETREEVARHGERPLFCQLTRGGRVLRRNALSTRAVIRAVKAAAERAGLDPAQYGGHSLRSGFATAAALRGKSHRSIMRQLLHTKRETTDRYIRDARAFHRNAASGIL